MSLRNLATVQDGVVRDLMRQLERDTNALRVRVSSLEARLHSLEFYSDADRPKPEQVRSYTLIFNIDDGFVNVSDGKNWLDPTGAVT